MLRRARHLILYHDPGIPVQQAGAVCIPYIFTIKAFTFYSLSWQAGRQAMLI